MDLQLHTEIHAQDNPAIAKEHTRLLKINVLQKLQPTTNLHQDHNHRPEKANAIQRSTLQRAGTYKILYVW